MIAVTGLLHSGTSAVAGMLHAMGVRMVETGITAPVPGGYNEFEDPSFTHWAAGGARQDQFDEWYAARREAHAGWASTYGYVHPQWGVKTPYLLRCWRRFEELVRSTGDEVHWVLLERQPEECLSQVTYWARSYVRDARLRDAMVGMHEAVNRELQGVTRPDGLVVHWENVIRAPSSVARQLCRRFGIDLDMSTRAAKTITPS